MILALGRKVGNEMTECPFCYDSEGFAIQLDEDGICPVCGEDLTSIDA